MRTNKISYKLVFNRKRHMNKNHKALIQVEIYGAGRRKYLSTHIYISSRQWDGRKRMVRNHPDAAALNFYLYDQIGRLESAEMTLWRQNREISVETIIGLAETRIFRPMLFIDFCQEHTQTANIKPSTVKNRMSTIKLLRLFSPRLSFADLGEEWLRAFEHYLLHVRGLRCNTVAKHLNHIRICVNAAEKKNIWRYENPPFRHFHIRKEPVERGFLSENELQRLEQWSRARQSNLCRYVDAFLFCCYSGLRFSDFCRLTADNFKADDNAQWLILHTQKTAAEVRLPLHVLFRGKCLGLLEKYAAQPERLFCLGDNSNTNKRLQRACKLAGIDKHVSFHTARHTFATLLLQRGVNISTVQKLLGHKRIQTTQIYGAVTDRTVVEDLLAAR